MCMLQGNLFVCEKSNYLFFFSISRFRNLDRSRGDGRQIKMDGSQHPSFEDYFACQSVYNILGNESDLKLSDFGFEMGDCVVEKTAMLNVGEKIHAYSTPVIFAMGILGNSISLKIFLSKNFRRQAGGVYLASLSCADIFALVFFVMTQWLKRVWPIFTDSRVTPVVDTDGLCQVILYLSYTSRFLSSWLVVTFTVERYIGVCHPFKRLEWCTTKTARRGIVVLTLISLVFNSFKPALSGVYMLDGELTKCTGNPDYHYVSFILDSVYAVSITLVPFVVILLLNVMIIRALVKLKKRQKTNQVKAKEAGGRTDFTLLLLMISFCFIALKVPFFVTWCRQFLYSLHLQRDTSGNIDNINRIEIIKGILNITRTVFYMNYATNFFLYSFVGSSFRLELKRLVCCQCRENRSYSWTPQRTCMQSDLSHGETFKRNTAQRNQTVDDV